MQAKLVTKIDANPLLSKQNKQNAILRVAAYCRVSTDSEDQLESYKAQVAHYTDAISKNPRWRFVEIYADEGITGTLAKKRPNFMRMIRDCKRGKIDLILTKSVARFARNTVDSLNYVRQLKALGVGVFFEEQNLDSMKTDSEMFIGLHSVLAQAESENISANVRWGIQQRMRSGTFAFRYNILGYRKGQDGAPEIVPEEAECIRSIYTMYLNGNSLDQIKVSLERRGVMTKQGKNEWSKAQIKNILTNERYCGDMLLQKTYTENCITKKVKKNRGEMAKYLITDNHPAIIERQVFKAVQVEMARRNSRQRTSDKTASVLGKYSGKYALTDLLVCGECGRPYRRKTWSRGGKKKYVWRCLSRIEHGTQFCKHSPSVEEDRLHRAICRGMDRIIEDRRDVMEMLLADLSYGVTGDDGAMELYAIEEQIKTLEKELDDTIRLSQESGGNSKRFTEMVGEIGKRLAILREQLAFTMDKLLSNENHKFELERVRDVVLRQEVAFHEYDDTTVRLLVEYIKVMPEGKIVIVFKGGGEVEEVL